MRHVLLISSCLVALGARVARADDAACPMDFTVAAGGTWSTYVAEVLDACMADPACAAGRTTAGGPGADALMKPPPTRSPRGRFAVGSATLGARARGVYASGPAAGDAHLQVGATVQAGWHRGVRACGRTAIEVGERTQGTSAFGVVFPHGFWATALGFEQDWEVQPALSAPRRWLRRPYTSNRASFGFAVATWRHRGSRASSVLPMRVELAWRGQAEAQADATLMKTMRGAAYERVGGGQRLQIVPWSVDSIEPMVPRDPATPGEVAIDPTMVSPPPPGRWLGRVGLFALDRELGGGTHLDVSASVVLSPQRLRCRGCQRFAGGLGVSVPRGADRWHLRLDRSAFLAIDEVVTLEDRVSGGYQRVRRRHTLRATGFAAATRTASPPALAPEDVAFTGGALLAVDIGLGQGVTMTTELEVARSFYAHLDGGVAPVVEPAARLGVVLARRFGRRGGR